ncbi:MAG: transcriptional regulator of arginine metabolism [Psychroserpens sp.]|jgi:transcriptional regulator of arginine metabolism
MHNSTNTKLLSSFKSLLKEESLGSQRELSMAMSKRGFANVSQTKISRLLTKCGAIKRRNKCNEPVYKLPGIHLVPNKKQTINSVVLNVQHNNIQIVVKTIVGGGSLISKIIESMPITIGIIGCIASSDTILVIPSNINNIDRTAQMIIAHLNVDYSET